MYLFLQTMNNAHMPSTSFSPAGMSKGNASKPIESSEITNVNHGKHDDAGPSSSWISSLRRISSAK